MVVDLVLRHNNGFTYPIISSLVDKREKTVSRTIKDHGNMDMWIYKCVKQVICLVILDFIFGILEWVRVSYSINGHG